jgi:hypothetical protein
MTSNYPKNEKQMRAYRAQLAIERVLRDIELELARGTERRHLEPRCELAQLYLADLGPTTLAACHRAKFEALEAQVVASGPRFPPLTVVR